MIVTNHFVRRGQSRSCQNGDHWKKGLHIVPKRGPLAEGYLLHIVPKRGPLEEGYSPRANIIIHGLYRLWRQPASTQWAIVLPQSAGTTVV